MTQSCDSSFCWPWQIEDNLMYIQFGSWKHRFIVPDMGAIERGGQTLRLTFMWILKSVLASNNYTAHAQLKGILGQI